MVINILGLGTNRVVMYFFYNQTTIDRDYLSTTKILWEKVENTKSGASSRTKT